MELEFESGAVQWCGCLVHRADTELGARERESPAPAAIHSVANYTAPPPLTPVAMAGGRGSVLFWDGSDGGSHLSSVRLHSLTRWVSDSVVLALGCSHISAAGAIFDDGSLNGNFHEHEQPLSMHVSELGSLLCIQHFFSL